MTDLIFLILGMSVFVTFLFKREWLYDKKKFIAFFISTSILFIVSYPLATTQLGNSKFIAFLKAPVMSLAIFYIMKKIYFFLYRKDAADTFWSNDISLMKDGVFNFIFGVVGIVVPAILCYHL